MASYKEQECSVRSAIFVRDNEEEKNQTTLGVVGAIIVLAIACCRRILVTFLTEKWRVHVFLVLNFLLLSIFVTSRRCTPGGNQQQQQQVVGNLEEKIINEEKEEEEEDEEMVVIDEEEEEPRECDKLDIGKVVINSDDAPNYKLSKEELNRRVEAFISMFRQQLVLDARSYGGIHKFQGIQEENVQFGLLA